MPITVVNNNSLVSTLQQTNPVTINLPSAVDMSSVALQAAVESEGWSQDANDAADRAEVAASALGETACTFHPRDYIPAAQMVHILNNDVAAQDETIVTAGLRAMHDAAMAWVIGGTNRTSICRYAGTMAVNDELFSDYFAEELWTIGYNTGTFIFEGDGFAAFQIKGWGDHKAIRSVGMWAGVSTPVPKAVFRWEQKTGYLVGPQIRNIEIRGTALETPPGNDPIGFKVVRANAMSLRNLYITNIRNIGRMIEGVVNSREYDCAVEGCGLQPTNAGGSGWMPESATFSVTGTSVVASEPSFSPEARGAILLGGAGENGHVHRSFYTYVDSTHITLTTAAATNVSDTAASHGVITCDTTAGGNVVTLSGPCSFDFVGRYVIVTFAGSGITPNFDHLVTRVTAQSGRSLTLASPTKYALNATPLILAPADFIGRTTDDWGLNGGRSASPANDIQFYGLRNNNPNYKGRGNAPNLFINDAYNVAFLGGKLHGEPPLYNNFGANWAIYIADNCLGLTFSDMQLKWGKYDGLFGSQVITGQAASVTLRDVQIGNNFAVGNARHFYLAPRSSSVDWNVMISGIDQSGNGWPNTNQGLVRYGNYGSSKHLTALGPLVLEGTPIVNNPGEPVTRHRSVRSATAGFGIEPTTTAVVAIGSPSAYVPQEIWLGADRFLWRINAAGLQMGKAISAGAETYPVKVNWDAAGDSIIAAATYVQVRKPRLTGIPSYANNAAAISGGLSAGDTYQVSGSDPRQLAIVY